MKYNWTNAHPDTRWIAVDSDGSRVEYTVKPHMSDWQWLVNDCDHILAVHRSNEYQGDWKDSLEEREGD